MTEVLTQAQTAVEVQAFAILDLKVPTWALEADLRRGMLQVR